jgi:integrase
MPEAKLTERQCAAPYHGENGSREMRGDGGGLYLSVKPTGGKSWVFRYMKDGARHDLGLGPYQDITLAEARDKAREQRRHRLDGNDPLQLRQAGRDARRLEAARAMTFKDCAVAYMKAHAAERMKDRGQWEKSLAQYVYPVIGTLPVKAIDTPAVLRVLEPIWNTVPTTADRLRGRIELILGWATTGGYREGDNPARWRGHLSNLLAKPGDAKRAVRAAVGRDEHHAALPYAEIGAFLADLRARQEPAARALEYTILTAARAGEVLGAQRSEFDRASKVWTISGLRMKAGKEHRVPLSDAALALVGDGERPFDAVKFSQNMLKVLRQMGYADATVHGFRSTFRDWAAERTAYPREVVEMALAHTIGDKVEAAYRRGDLFDKRRRLMDEWARFCAQPASADVVPIRA